MDPSSAQATLPSRTGLCGPPELVLRRLQHAAEAVIPEVGVAAGSAFQHCGLRAELMVCGVHVGDVGIQASMRHTKTVQKVLLAP